MTDTKLVAKVLTLIQSEFPICARPYAEIGTHIGISEKDAFEIVENLVNEKTIRRIGAIFDSYRLGYKSTLCAIAITDQDDLENAIGVINAFPNVTHNYERDDHYNLWFTVIARSEEDIEHILTEISKETGYDDILNLPAIRLFKIKVDFDLTGERADEATQSFTVPAGITPTKLSSVDIRLIRELQKNIAGRMTPYDDISQAINQALPGANITTEDVIARIIELKDNKTIRRFGAAIKHHNLGFTHNAMVVWDVPDADVPAAGLIMAAHKEVSHCYERPRTTTWTSNMYSMTHGTSEQQCREIVAKIHEELTEAGIEVDVPRLLYSTRELKKISMSYFTEE